MADLPASERAYQRLRHDILNGVVRAGPIDIRRVGDKLRMSVTPVREALARLSAERLVRPAPHHGYVIVPLSARRLENLYELSGALLRLAVKRCRASVAEQAAGVGAPRDLRTYEAGMTSIATEIARAQGSLELCEHIEAVTDRLILPRRCEPAIFRSAMDELQTLCALWDDRRFPRLGAWLGAHFVSRAGRSDAIARAVSDAAGEPS
jgi:DNA-binding GntR family transcriptional regulator